MSLVTRTLVAALATSLVAAIPCACALDWDVRPDPGTGPDVLVPEASTEAAADAIAPDAATDGTTVDAGECDALLASVVSAKLLARTCQLGGTGQCTTTVKDECACDVVVRLASDPKTDEYVAAVAAYLASCTPSSCAACPQLGVPGSWACLQSGGEIRCVP